MLYLVHCKFTSKHYTIRIINILSKNSGEEPNKHTVAIQTDNHTTVSEISRYSREEATKLERASSVSDVCLKHKDFTILKLPISWDIAAQVIPINRRIKISSVVKDP